MSARSAPHGSGTLPPPTKAAMQLAAKTWDHIQVARIADERPDLLASADRQGRLPLHLACAATPTPPRSDPHGIITVDAILQRGTEIESVVPIPDGNATFPATPLWYAAARGCNQPLVEHLLFLGARPDHCLWAVVWRDDAAMCRVMLAANPVLDLIFDGETPLFYAVRLRRLQTLALLLDAGADAAFLGPGDVSVEEMARRRRLPRPVVERIAAAAA